MQPQDSDFVNENIAYRIISGVKGKQEKRKADVMFYNSSLTWTGSVSSAVASLAGAGVSSVDASGVGSSLASDSGVVASASASASALAESMYGRYLRVNFKVRNEG